VLAHVNTGGLAWEDLRVEAYMGPLDSRGEISKAEITLLSPVGREADGVLIYEAHAVPCDRSGRHGFTVRATPCHRDLAQQFLPGLIAWATPAPEKAQGTK
jgi:starch phosphorylase